MVAIFVPTMQKGSKNTMIGTYFLIGFVIFVISVVMTENYKTEMSKTLVDVYAEVFRTLAPLAIPLWPVFISFLLLHSVGVFIAFLISEIF